MKTQDKEQSLMEAAKAYAKSQHSASISSEGYENIADDWLTGAKSQAAKEYHKQEWVAVTERLPENSGEYLGLVKSYNSYSCNIFYWRTDRRTFDVYGLGRREPVTDMNVVKWMNLPDLSVYHTEELPTINKE